MVGDSGPDMGETVYFDLETQRSFNDVGGSSNIVKMGVSVACAYSTETGEYSIYREEELDDLVALLVKADLVVGHNHVKFDYGVLEAYTVLDLAAQTVNLDMLIDLEKHTNSDVMRLFMAVYESLVRDEENQIRGFTYIFYCDGN